MKPLKTLTLALCLGAVSLPAQDQTDVDQLKKQLQEMKESFERVQREQRQQIDALTKKLDALTSTNVAVATTPSATNAAPAAAATTAAQKQAEADLAAQLEKELGTNAAPATPAPALPTKAFSPSQPITMMRAGSAYMNISFDTQMTVGYSTAPDPSAQLELGDHDPIKRGFSLRNAEIAVDGAVDPYFKGFGNIVLKLDKNNETSIELEEAYLLSTSLPHNLQVKAGQFFAPFGRQNPQHPHQWAFVDAPIMLTRAFGPDGLRSISGQVSWLTPLPFYTEVFLDVLDGQGSTSFSFRNPGEPDASGVDRFAGRATNDRNLRGLQDLVYVPHISSSFDLSDTQTLVLGLSGAFGSNETGPQSRSEVYGADIYWKWKPANAAEGFPFVSWQTEGLYRRFGAGADPTAPTPLPSENLRDYGFYSQVLYGFKPHWVTGLRGEYATGNSGTFDPNDPFRGERYRVSPVLTWYPSEFSKIRLQYNYDWGQDFGNEHSIWMQVEFLLGAHGAHKF